MSPINDILSNYRNRRHLLQTMHLPAKPYGGPDFLYMKNHKAACTNILTLLITQMHNALGGDAAPEISMDGVHNLPTDYLRAGARGLTWETAQDALTGPGWFRFTMVRDPLSRTVSAWSDKLQPGSNPRHLRDLNTYLGRPADTEITLPAFLDLLAQDDGARDLDRHWRPQHKEISYGLVSYDLIGRVEAMDDARRAIIRALFGTKGEAVEAIDTRKHLGHRTASQQHRDSLTAADRRNVDRAFARDFEMYEEVAGMEAA
jgi:hypothetical protein